MSADRIAEKSKFKKNKSDKKMKNINICHSKMALSFWNPVTKSLLVALTFCFNTLLAPIAYAGGIANSDGKTPEEFKSQLFNTDMFEIPAMACISVTNQFNSYNQFARNAQLVLKNAGKIEQLAQEINIMRGGAAIIKDLILTDIGNIAGRIDDIIKLEKNILSKYWQIESLFKELYLSYLDALTISKTSTNLASAQSNLTNTFGKMYKIVGDIEQNIPLELRRSPTTGSRAIGRSISTISKVFLIATILLETILLTNCNDGFYLIEPISQKYITLVNGISNPFKQYKHTKILLSQLSPQAQEGLLEYSKKYSVPFDITKMPSDITKKDIKTIQAMPQYWIDVLKAKKDFENKLAKKMINDLEESRYFINNPNPEELTKFIREQYGIKLFKQQKDPDNNQDDRLFIPQVELALQERIMAMNDMQYNDFLKSIDIPNYNRDRIKSALFFVRKLRKGEETLYAKLLKLNDIH